MDANAITAANRGFAEFTAYLVYTGASRELVTGTEVTVRAQPDRTPVVTRNEIYDGETGDRTLLTASEDVA